MPDGETSRLVVAMTGASGARYGVRLLQRGVSEGFAIDLVLSGPARRVIRTELGTTPDLDGLLGGETAAVRIHSISDVGARIASGSYPTLGMVVIPCSMGTLSRIACGVSSNLIERAADVQLKERRPLVLVVRETPLSSIHLENMLRLSRSGATILPASPAFYARPESVGEMVDFVVDRAFQALGHISPSAVRWTGEES